MFGPGSGDEPFGDYDYNGAFLGTGAFGSGIIFYAVVDSSDSGGGGSGWL